MQTHDKPSFYVGSIPIFGDLILAPMDGVSDLPFRVIARRLGSAMSYTEFINARDVVFRHPDLPRRLSYIEEERPVVYQLFDDDPDKIIQAAIKLHTKYNPDIIDINLGCSAKTVTHRGAGAALLKSPEKIAEIFSRLRQAVPIPITAKIRLGWDEQSLNYIEVAQIIQDNGGQLIAVHGRTKNQAYAGHANWEAIAEVKQAVSIPVIANGDVKTVEDIHKIKQVTGCDGVMVGRAALENPWLFSYQDKDQITSAQIFAYITEHLSLMIDFYGEERGMIFFRKYLNKILHLNLLEKEIRLRFLTCHDSKELIPLMQTYLKISV